MENNKPKIPAFACASEYGYQSGQDLRDYFAAKAMQAILSNPNIGNVLIETGASTMDEGDETIATTSYRMADVMIKQREL